jgi:catechol 2,3-dioxygenase-like lactoylglutathione lyase family enzyme
MGFVIDHLDHLVLTVASIDATVAFYRSALGMELELLPGSVTPVSPQGTMGGPGLRESRSHATLLVSWVRLLSDKNFLDCASLPGL